MAFAQSIVQFCSDVYEPFMQAFLLDPLRPLITEIGAQIERIPSTPLPEGKPMTNEATWLDREPFAETSSIGDCLLRHFVCNYVFQASARSTRGHMDVHAVPYFSRAHGFVGRPAIFVAPGCRHGFPHQFPHCDCIARFA
eukprot:GEMP01055408.1.p2 GENE.GEMP01055408.1~~GEMP01055408.1.p2  ORF type:complete len:153 (+),score=15.47 GEMP01055408.1:40-459(+)